ICVCAQVRIQNVHGRTRKGFPIRIHHTSLKGVLLSISEQGTQNHADTQYNPIHDIHRLCKGHKIQPVWESNKRGIRLSGGYPTITRPRITSIMPWGLTPNHASRKARISNAARLPTYPAGRSSPSLAESNITAMILI